MTSEIEEAITKLLFLKYSEIKNKIIGLKMEHLIGYLKNVVMRKSSNQLSLVEIAYFIMNIRINMLMEYINISAVTKCNSSIMTDFDDIMKG